MRPRRRRMLMVHRRASRASGPSAGVRRGVAGEAATGVSVPHSGAGASHISVWAVVGVLVTAVAFVQTGWRSEATVRTAAFGGSDSDAVPRVDQLGPNAVEVASVQLPTQAVSASSVVLDVQPVDVDATVDAACIRIKAVRDIFAALSSRAQGGHVAAVIELLHEMRANVSGTEQVLEALGSPRQPDALAERVWAQLQRAHGEVAMPPVVFIRWGRE